MSFFLNIVLFLYILFYSSPRFLFVNNEFLQVPKSFLLEVLGKDRVTKFVIQEILNSTMADYAKKASCILIALLLSYTYCLCADCNLGAVFELVFLDAF